MSEEKTNQVRTRMPQAALRGLEKPLVRVNEAMNQTPTGRNLIAIWQKGAAGPFVRWVTKYRWELHHLERVQAVVPKRGTILVANHRSLFDMFVTLSVLFIDFSQPFSQRVFATDSGMLGHAVRSTVADFDLVEIPCRVRERWRFRPTRLRPPAKLSPQSASCAGVPSRFYGRA